LPTNTKNNYEIDERFVFNASSERGLLSVCIKNNDCIVEVESGGIHAEYFAVPGHKYIFMAITYLFSKRIKTTAVAIHEVLNNDKAKQAVKELGGLEYLVVLETSVIPRESLGIFVEKVKQSHTRRMLHTAGENIKKFSLSSQAEVLNPQELIDYANNQIDSSFIDDSVAKDAYKMGDDTEDVLQKRTENPTHIPGLEVHWPEYDRLTNGAVPGDLIVLCAPSKTGKSTILLNWATNISIYDKIPILYIDTEMNQREQEDRILSNLTEIPYTEIVSGMYALDTEHGTSAEKLEKLVSARTALTNGAFYHLYMPIFTLEGINAVVRKFVLQNDIKALFFDYIKMPSNQSGSFKLMQEYQSLGFLTSGLKDIAGTMKIPVFSACQTNRNNLSTETPSANDIGGSYRILQLATKLMFLYNKPDEKIALEGFDNGNQQLFIKYQRNGESDCHPINIIFNKNILRQTEA
jgi:replicative DNA helicase